MRVPFAVVSAPQVVPLFVWLRLSVGTAGALVGTSLLAYSLWMSSCRASRTTTTR